MAKSDKKNDDTSEQLVRIDGRLNTIEKEVHGIRSSVRTAAAILGTLLLAIIGLGFTFGASWVRETARAVAREEMAYRDTYTQGGRFTPANRVSDSPPRFKWAMGRTFEPESVVEVDVRLTPTLPGVGVSGELVDGGAACEMTLHVSDQALANLPDELTAEVTVRSRPS